MKRVSRSFVDVHDRNAVAGDWEKRFTRTSVAPYRSELVAVVGEGALVVRDAHQGGLRFNGASGSESHYLVWCEGQALRLNGSSGWHRDIALIGPGTSMDGACPSDCQIVRLSFHGNMALRMHAELMESGALLPEISGPGLHRPQASQGERERLRWLLEELTAQSSAGAVAAVGGACREAIEDSLYSAAMSLLLASTRHRDIGVGGQGARRELCLRAESMIRDERSPPLTVGEWCRRLETSERLLELAFREQFGVCPRRMLIAVRLQRAHELLANAAPDLTVTQVATELGFWHFGRFSHYFRQMFGVLPSQTLQEHKPHVVVRAATASIWRSAVDSIAEHHSPNPS